MKLVVHELKTSGLIQEITPTKNYLLEAIRPHIYRHNWPSGSLKLQILNSSDEVLVESETIQISNISTNNFFHGYIRFKVSYGLTKNTPYKIKLVGTGGYSFSESAYIGICSDYDSRKYPVEYSPNNGLRAPLDLEIWCRSLK